MKIMKFFKMFILSTVLAIGISGCSTPQSCIVVTNQTGVGISIKENPQTQMYEVWMGYINSVFGLVPTNRAWNKDVLVSGGGAKDSANVLFETNFYNWFCFWNTQGLYQRVAIGDLAVGQPGAVAMFAKDSQGQISTQAIAAIKALAASTPAQLDLKTQIVKLGEDPVKKAQIVELLKAKSLTWDKFIDDKTLTDVDLKAILAGVK